MRKMKTMGKAGSKGRVRLVIVVIMVISLTREECLPWVGQHFGDHVDWQYLKENLLELLTLQGSI